MSVNLWSLVLIRRLQTRGFGGWCPPGGTPSVANAASTRFWAETRAQQALDALVPHLGSGFRNPVLGADHVVGIGVVARDLHEAAGDGWRVPMCPRLAGQGPGAVAGDSGGSGTTPLTTVWWSLVSP